jgi:hypothetical protein
MEFEKGSHQPGAVHWPERHASLTGLSIAGPAFTS